MQLRCVLRMLCGREGYLQEADLTKAKRIKKRRKKKKKKNQTCSLWSSAAALLCTLSTLKSKSVCACSSSAAVLSVGCCISFCLAPVLMGCIKHQLYVFPLIVLLLHSFFG